jgi:hypothetical protein
LINNRQNGRRRGRGGIRPPNGSSSGPERGNRVDNRARGNASQLHEKYKTLARDAQMQGDRVNSEYYLQFADHYFRVLSESRARFEEQRRPRDDVQGREDSQRGDDYQPNADYQSQNEFQDEYDDGGEADGDDRGNQQAQRGDRYEEPRSDRRPRNSRPQAEDRGNRGNGNGGGREPREPREPRFEQSDIAFREERPAYGNRGNGEERVAETRAPELSFEEKPSEAPVVERRPRGRPRRAQAESVEAVAEERIDIDRLPPAFTPEPEAAEEKPRRRTRRPRSDAAAADA